MHEELGKIVSKPTSDHDVAVRVFFGLLSQLYGKNFSVQTVFDVTTLCIIRVIDTLPKNERLSVAQGVAKGLVNNFEEK